MAKRERRFTGGSRPGVFEQIGSSDGITRFKFPVRGLSALFIVVGAFFALIGLLFLFYTPHLLGPEVAVGAVFALLGTVVLAYGFSLLWTHRRMEIDGPNKTLRLILRTPIRERIVPYEFKRMRSLHVWPVSVDQRVSTYHAGIEMDDGRFLEIGQGQEADVRTLATRVAELTGLHVHADRPSA